MKSDLSTGIFRDLATTFSDLVRMTPPANQECKPKHRPGFLENRGDQRPEQLPESSAAAVTAIQDCGGIRCGSSCGRTRFATRSSDRY
jgi:hypothetical protein